MFDPVAPAYDPDFTHTPLGHALRVLVWRELDRHWAAGEAVLELACGTGEDARHLAQRGVHVLATDQSPAMITIARHKCAGLPVTFARLDVADRDAWATIPNRGMWAGAFSNFGGLNALSDYAPLAAALSAWLRPGGLFSMVIMGRHCAWEVAWHLAHGQPRQAFRRWSPAGATAQVGQNAMRVYYPTTAQLRHMFAPYFQLRRMRPIGVYLPPSYLEPLTRRRWFPLRLCAWLDAHTPAPLWGDHTLYVWERRPTGAIIGFGNQPAP
jgi:SAM-dependent methyltransferase